MTFDQINPFSERKVVVIDDDVSFAAGLSEALQKKGYQVRYAKSFRDIDALMGDFSPQVICSDPTGGQNTFSDISRLQQSFPQVLQIIWTVCDDCVGAQTALDSAVYAYLQKPFLSYELYATLERCFEKMMLEYQRDCAEKLLTIRNKELEESNKRLRKIFDSTRRIALCDHLEEFAPQLVKEFAENMGASSGSLYVRGPKAFTLLHSLDHMHVPAIMALPFDHESVFARVLTEKKALFCSSMQDAQSTRNVSAHTNATCAIFPLFDLHENIIGLLCLHSKEGTQFAEDDIAFGMLLSSYTSESLHVFRTKENLLKNKNELQKRQYEFDIRVKELNCLFSISSIIDNSSNSVEEVLAVAIEIIPEAFQFPDVLCAEISISGRKYRNSGNAYSYDEVKKKFFILQRPIEIFGTKVGTISVWYCAKKPQSAEGPFLKEESRLVSAIGELLGNIIERKRAGDELTNSVEKLRGAMEGIIKAMALTAEMRDPYTAGHQRRVSKLAKAIAEEMRLPDVAVESIRLAAIIHDLGKITVPAEILSKPGFISSIEYDFIKTHAQVGHDILKTIEFPWPLAKIIHQHHERLDGSGYPQKLSGDEILFEAQVISVADTVEAMASHRPYRAALGTEKALAEIEKHAGKLYHPEVVAVCTDLFRKKGFTFD